MIFGVHPPWTLYFDYKNKFWAELPTKWPIYPFYLALHSQIRIFEAWQPKIYHPYIKKNEFSQGILNLGYAY